MPSSEYHLKQAQIAASLALNEPDETKATHFQLLALEQFEKAEMAEKKAEEAERQSHPSRPTSEQDRNRA